MDDPAPLAFSPCQSVQPFPISVQNETRKVINYMVKNHSNICINGGIIYMLQYIISQYQQTYH